MRTWRLVAPPSLLIRPLTYGLEQGFGDGRISLTFLPPEACEAALREETADGALLSLSGLRRLSLKRDVRVFPRWAVVGRRAPGIATLYSQHPWPKVTAVRVPNPLSDEVDCLRDLCRRRGMPLRWVVDSDAETDGELRIGDDRDEPAPFPYASDVFALWSEATGLPFVHAVWASFDDRFFDWGMDGLGKSAEAGLRHVEDIARAHAESTGEDPSLYRTLLGEALHYRLDADALSGAATFLEGLRQGENSIRSTRVRFFDAALAPQRPTIVPWPLEKDAGRALPSIDSLLSDGAAGIRLSPESALRLYQEAALAELGLAADARRKVLHPGHVVTYIIDRNVNYTNVCVTACKFCNFFRPVKSREGYTLDKEALATKFQETVDLEGIQILLQGGLNPNLPLSYYEDLFRFAKENFPLALHALSPEEIRYLAELEGLTIRQVLERLIAAGLDSLPGAGAEILDDEIRHRISPLKCSTEVWLNVMREAHALGLRTTSTLVFGFGEHAGHIVGHLERLRALQDETAGFTAFICWPFQAEGTRLRLADDTSPTRYLRILALARLYLDNIPNLQVSWPTLGPAIGQVGLRFGGNDFGSAMIEENVVSQAGAVWSLSADEIEAQIRSAGFTPRRRNMRYEYLTVRE